MRASVCASASSSSLSLLGLADVGNHIRLDGGKVAFGRRGVGGRHLGSVLQFSDLGLAVGGCCRGAAATGVGIGEARLELRGPTGGTCATRRDLRRDHPGHALEGRHESTEWPQDLARIFGDCCSLGLQVSLALVGFALFRLLLVELGLVGLDLRLHLFYRTLFGLEERTGLFGFGQRVDFCGASLQSLDFSIVQLPVYRRIVRDFSCAVGGGSSPSAVT